MIPVLLQTPVYQFSLCKAKTEHFPGLLCYFTGPSSWVPLTQVLFIGLDFSVVEGGVAVLGQQLGLSYVAGMLRKLQDWRLNFMLTEGKKTSELCCIAFLHCIAKELDVLWKHTPFPLQKYDLFQLSCKKKIVLLTFSSKKGSFYSCYKLGKVRSSVIIT